VAFGKGDDAATPFRDILVRGGEGDSDHPLGLDAEGVAGGGGDSFLFEQGTRELASGETGPAEFDERVEGAGGDDGEQTGRLKGVASDAASSNLTAGTCSPSKTSAS
jgi:hypothetical protein